jgi:hypothetical protein
LSLAVFRSHFDGNQKSRKADKQQVTPSLNKALPPEEALAQIEVEAAYPFLNGFITGRLPK